MSVRKPIGDEMLEDFIRWLRSLFEGKQVAKSTSRQTPRPLQHWIALSLGLSFLFFIAGGALDGWSLRTMFQTLLPAYFLIVIIVIFFTGWLRVFDNI